MKGDIILFSFRGFISVLVPVKDLESEKGQQKLLFPTEHTAPETPRQKSCL